MFLESITMDELKRGLKKIPVVIVPFGSVEEHGPHLPLSTDTYQIVEVLKIVEKERNVFIAPPIHYGVCRSTEQHRGTIGITPETLRGLVYDILCSLKKEGFKAVILVSGHAGKLHVFSIVEACEKFQKSERGMRIFVYSELELLGKEALEIIETNYDSHAGEIETSRMLAINKRLVKDCYKKLKPDCPKFFPGEIVSDKVKYWKSGIWGNPSFADKEKGRKLLQLSAQKLIEVIDKINL